MAANNRILWVVALTLLGVEAVWPSPVLSADAAGKWSPKTVIAECAIKTDGSAIFVPVTVNGTKMAFWLDTGCSFTLLDDIHAAFAHELPGSVQSPYFGTTKEVKLAECKNVSIAGSPPLSLSPVVLHLLAPISFFSGKKTDGILGGSFLKDFMVHLDFDNQRVLFVQQKSDVAPPPGVPIPFEMNGDCPIVELLIGSEKIEFLIDTGCSVPLLLPEGHFSDLVKTAHIALDKSEGRAFSLESGFLSTRGGYLAKLELAGTAHENVHCTAEEHGIIGLPLLSKFIVTIDYPNKLIYFQPGKRTKMLDHSDCDGLLIMKPLFGGTCLVSSSDPEKSGFKNGIREDDKIISIDGIHTATISTSEVQRILKFERYRDLSLVISHEGERRTLVLAKDGADAVLPLVKTQLEPSPEVDTGRSARRSRRFLRR